MPVRNGRATLGDLPGNLAGEFPGNLAGEYAACVIVVVGQPLFRATEDGAQADGLAARIALAAAVHGRAVQLVGKASEDAEGDAIVLALARGGVGHAALHRDAGQRTPRAVESIGDDVDSLGDGAGDPTGGHAPADAPAAWTALDAADLDLALRYLAEYAVLVLADPAGPEIVGVAAEAAGYAGARLVVVVRPGEAVPDGLAPDVIVFEAPDTDPDGVFGSFVGSFAAALDDGDEPAAAFRSSIEADGWTTSPDA